jgi:hypothetical protein
MSKEDEKACQKKPINPKQRAFVDNWLKHKNATQAAKDAGYSAKVASVIGCKLLDPDEYPLVAAYAQEQLAIMEKTLRKSAKEVLDYIHDLMDICWAQHLMPSKMGKWELTEQQFINLPPNVGRFIESFDIERNTYTDSEGLEHESVKYTVKLVSKTAAMMLAAKHQLMQKLQLQLAPSEGVREADWEAIATAGRSKRTALQERLKALPAPVAAKIIAPHDIIVIDQAVTKNGDHP